MLQAGLTWPQALALALAGAYVRRERWTDKRLFLTAGGLVWVDGSPSRVVRAADFGRSEFLAMDWTNMGFDQGDCIPHPGWTHIHIDAQEQVANPQTGWALAAPPGGRATWANPFSVEREAHVWANTGYGGGAGISMHGFTFLRQSPLHYNGTTNGIYTVAPGATMLWGGGVWGLYGGITFEPETNPQPPLQRVIPNPFSAPCSVQISGVAQDALLLNGMEVALPASFSLQAGDTFTLAALLRNPAIQPVASFDLDVDFSIEEAPLPG